MRSRTSFKYGFLAVLLCVGSSSYGMDRSVSSASAADFEAPAFLENLPVAEAQAPAPNQPIQSSQASEALSSGYSPAAMKAMHSFDIGMFANLFFDENSDFKGELQRLDALFLQNKGYECYGTAVIQQIANGIKSAPLNHTMPIIDSIHSLQTELSDPSLEDKQFVSAFQQTLAEKALSDLRTLLPEEGSPEASEFWVFLIRSQIEDLKEFLFGTQHMAHQP